MAAFLRRWLSRIRFSLLTMVLLSLLVGSLGALWWRWEPWAVVAVLRNENPPTYLTISNDGSKLLAVDSKQDWSSVNENPREFAVWDTIGGNRLFKKGDKGVLFHSFSFSEDSRWIFEWNASVRKARLFVCHADTGEVVKFYQADNQPLLDASISPDGRLVALAFQKNGEPNNGKFVLGAPLIYDLEAGRVITRFPDDESIQLSPHAFSSDSKWIAFQLMSTDDKLKVKGVRIYATDSTNVAFESEDFQGLFFLKKSSRIVLAGQRKSAVLEWPSENKIMELDGRVITIFKGEKHAIACVEPEIDVDPEKYSFLLQSLQDDSDRVTLVTDGHYLVDWVLANGRLFASQWQPNNDALIVWDAYTGGRLFTIPGKAVVSPDGRLIAVPDGNNVKIIGVESQEPLQILKGHTDEVSEVLFFPDSSRLASASKDGKVRIWQRRRPEYEWGVLVLPELWLSLVLFVTLVWSVWRDRKVAARVNPN
ncbi:MAG: hypothetical protein HY291_19285 [Planctomycetes bacterium]|nr:hypothetical protein [Planctomycetota bacterium]